MKFLIQFSSLNNLRLQGTSSLYVYKELQIKGTIFHDPKEFVISGIYCTWFLFTCSFFSSEQNCLHNITSFMISMLTFLQASNPKLNILLKNQESSTLHLKTVIVTKPVFCVLLVPVLCCFGAFPIRLLHSYLSTHL